MNNLIHKTKEYFSRHWQDFFIAALIGIAFSISSYQRANSIPSIIFEHKTYDVWFQSDPPALHDTMTIRNHSHHERNNAHPLFSLVAYPLTHFIKNCCRVDVITAIRLVIAGVAFLWIFIFYMILRSLNCKRLDAVLFCSLLIVSSTSMFWFSVPETFSFGSLSILLALWILILSQRYALSKWWYIFSNVATFGFVITNWMAGILTTLVNYRFKEAVRIIISAFGIATLLFGVVKYFFPQTLFFLNLGSEVHYMTDSNSGGPLNIATVFFYHTLVMPSIQFINNLHFKDSVWPLIMSIQHSKPGSAGPFGLTAVVLWTALLAIGVWALIFLKDHKKIRLTLGLLILGQLGLHIFYGEETFLYALNFFMLLIVLVALGALTKLRIIVILLVTLLIPCVAINNKAQFNNALDIFQHYGSLRQQVKIQKHFRPDDPWPRQEEHVVLAFPGTSEFDKAYHQAGGNFSPSVNSFGVSIWVTDIKGSLIKLSENTSLKEVHQQFIDIKDQPIPGIVTDTDYYQAAWISDGLGQWKLNLKNKKPDETHLTLVIRGVGPAAGPINSLIWNDHQLLINKRWILHSNVMPEIVNLGDERTDGWIIRRENLSQWEGHDGWGYAKIFLSQGDSWSFTIEDPLFKPTNDLSYAHLKTNLILSLPDKRFVDSLNAQVAHIMMGTVDHQTRAADPMMYSLPWIQQEAYIITALASAGQLDAAKQLSKHLAEQDFFGPFGSEAVAPGLSVWALEEVARRIQQPEFDEFIWPHVLRKTEIIEKILSAQENIYADFENMTNPKMEEKASGYHWTGLIAKSAQEGLAYGKTDEQFPVFYVNAINYMGLKNAGALASRLSHSDIASRWQTKAENLKQAWERKYLTSKHDPTYDYVNVLWPSGIVNAKKDLFKEELKARWTKKRNEAGGFLYPPIRTYLTIAETHQWLLLNEPDRVWKTLQWFWNNQTSPGLYTWWEQNRNIAHIDDWENSRGWMNSTLTTPHYGTAAEMLLLQLDMLAYLDEQASEPTIVIGAGIPQEWLTSPMEVKGLSLPERTLDWKWDGSQMQVTITGALAKIKLGSAFPSTTPINTTYVNNPLPKK